jgi:hypothetical protein
MTATTRDDGGNATKRRVCSFSGQEYVSERIGDELVIFCMGDEAGMPGASVVGYTGDGGAAGIRAMNKANAKLRGEA